MNQSIPRNSKNENPKTSPITMEIDSPGPCIDGDPDYPKVANDFGNQPGNEEISSLIARFKTAAGSKQKKIDRWVALWGLAILFSGFVIVSGFFIAVGGDSEKELSKPPALYQLDLNTANFQELCAVPKIGPATAKRILVKRKEIGRYRSLDQLQKIKGLGPKSVHALKDYLFVNDSVPERH